jgi:hypothetical protein
MKRSHRSGALVSVLLIALFFLVLPATGLTASVSGFPQIKSGKAATVDLSTIVTGGTPPYHCTLGSKDSLPDGLVLLDDCTITGTHTIRQGATEEVSPPFTIEVSDSASPPGTTRFSLSIMTRAASPTLLPETGRCTEKTPCTTKVAGAWGGTPPYHFQSGSFADGAPPMGMVVDLNGNLKGTAPAAGTYSFSICVVDSVGESACGTSSVVISPAPTPAPSAIGQFPFWLFEFIPGFSDLIDIVAGNSGDQDGGTGGYPPTITPVVTRTTAGCSGSTPYYYDGSCHASPKTTQTKTKTPTPAKTSGTSVDDVCARSDLVGGCYIEACTENAGSSNFRLYYRTPGGKYYCSGSGANINCDSAIQKVIQSCM